MFLTAKNLDTLFKPKSSGLWTRYIAPFSETEIKSYLEKMKNYNNLAGM